MYNICNLRNQNKTEKKLGQKYNLKITQKV